MECFRLLFDHLAWIDNQFLSSIGDSRKEGNLWGMMRGGGGVRKSEYQSWVPTRQSVNKEYYVEVLREFSMRFRRKRPALFKLSQWHFHQDNALVHNSILVTDYLTKIGIKTVPHPTYSRDLAPSDFWLFPKLHVYSCNKSAHTKKSGNLFNDTALLRPQRFLWVQNEVVTNIAALIILFNINHSFLFG